MDRRASVNADLISKSNIGDVLGNIPHTVNQQVRLLTLNDNEHLSATIFRLEKGWILEFRLGPSLLGKTVTIWTNHPSTITEDFMRDNYQKLNWHSNANTMVSDDTSLYAILPVRRAGSFHYYFLYEGGTKEKPNGSGYFVVDPVLPLGVDNSEILPLDCIQCQTVLAKSLGPFEEWIDRLRVSKESGYNMIHFTPIQELGASNSSYSLQDQLKLNPIFNASFEKVKDLTTQMRRDWKVLSLCDIVLNHTANESPWLIDHPECTYNMETASHLIPAAILDAHLHLLTISISQGKLESLGIPREICRNEHLEAIRWYLETTLMPLLRLDELYTCDVEEIVNQFQTNILNKTPVSTPGSSETIAILQDAKFRRKKSTVDMNLTINAYNILKTGVQNEAERVSQCANDLRKKLQELNDQKTTEINGHLKAAIGNCIAGIHYYYLQADGPKLKEVSEKYPLVPRYFTGQFKDASLIEGEIYSDSGRYVMAHNGWVMNSDALRNFAAPDSNVYIRRELIAWGDSVKLRFGDKPSDCPFLWKHMQNYVEQTALIFDGIRLDNCHATPIHVAEYLLDCARRVRPDLYIAAELFTNSDQTDNVFVNRLGITSLIREALSAWDSHEQGRLVYRYGGEPTGSFIQWARRPLNASIAHALFLDVTHDNVSPIVKRCVFDLPPSSGLVAMACCASGSTRGYDELVPHHIHVVDEPRLYTKWTDGPISNASQVNSTTGIISIKKALNDLHYRLGLEGFNQIFVDQMSSDVVAVTRHNPVTLKTVVLISYTAFHPPQGFIPETPQIRGLQVEGQLVKILLEASFVNANPQSLFDSPKNFKPDPDFINGLNEYVVHLQQNIAVSHSKALSQIDHGDDRVINCAFKCFQPGCVVALEIHPHPQIRPLLEELTVITNKLLSDCYPEDLTIIIDELSLIDLNYALYQCSQEGKETYGDSYNVPNYGSLVYCGLQGFISVFSQLRLNNDLGHPVCDNLRQGNWMLEYIASRLKQNSGTKKLGIWMERQFNMLQQIPRYLIPRFFDAIITGVYNLLISHAAKIMSDFVREGSTLVRALALGSVQCVGFISSATLPPLSPSLQNVNAALACITMSAGLPHFTTGYMRSWGRDTFIAFRGLLLLTGRFEEGRYHILGYGACLRHGLIPNLLDRGINARYNCRDAVWWWLYSIMEYIKLKSGNADILKDAVSRIYPTDDSLPVEPGLADMPLCDVMQEALQTHFQGLSFRERNAGRQIDAHMRENGFNNQIGVHLKTGFVFGGNNDNCGTWMDKMGSSEKAGNKGQPATPRDGSAVEIVALSKAVLRDIADLYDRGVYPYNEVTQNGQSWTLRQWEKRIEDNFERQFWISPTPHQDESKESLIHRRGIYKDSVGASKPWADYQLRCNFPIALVVAPEMVQPENAWKALELAKQVLLGPLGMRTLDPADWAYRGDYHNDNDSGDASVAHGFNYHQGPEWLWPVGFFLRARLYFAKIVGGELLLRQTIAETRSYISHHYDELLNSPWRGLPELTNKDGSYCADSCRTQAWSMACLLEVVYDLQKLEQIQL